MKNLFLLIALVVCSDMFAQMTLTSSYNPAPGDNQLLIFCDTTGINEGGSGANQNWNFANLTSLDSALVYIVASASTPYSAQFPTSTIASTLDYSDYDFYTTSSSDFIFNGAGGPIIVVPYSNPQQFFQYPCTYNSSFTDNFAATFSAGGVIIYKTGTATANCDAWGTINLPFGSFSNSIRIRYQVSEKDSSNPGIPTITNTNLLSFAWFVPGKKLPVLQMISITLTVNGVPQTPSKNVRYSPNNPSIGITQLNTLVNNNYELMQNFPNPFNPSTKIRFQIPNSSKVNIIIYDELGHRAADIVNEFLNRGSYEVEWNAGYLPSGVYYYKITADNFVETKKMILIK